MTLRGKASELPALQEKLKGFTEVSGPDAARINAAHLAKSLRAREEKVPGAISAALNRVVREIRSTQVAFGTTVESQIDHEVRRGANGDLFARLLSDIEAFSREMDAATTALRASAATAEASVGSLSSELAARHALQEAEYRSTIAASQEQDGRAAERSTLQQSLAAAQVAATELRATEKQREEILSARHELIRKTSELRDRRFALESGRPTASPPGFRAFACPSFRLQSWRATGTLFADALRGSGVKQGIVAEKLSQTFLPGELASVVAAGDYSIVAQRAGFDPERARKVVDALRSSGTYYVIETVDLDDRPCIELLDGGHIQRVNAAFHGPTVHDDLADPVDPKRAPASGRPNPRTTSTTLSCTTPSSQLCRPSRAVGRSFS